MSRYARTVTVDLDTGQWDDILTFGENVKERIADFPGLLTWHFVADRETGTGTSFAVFESREAFLDVNDQINAILSELGAYLVGPPTELLGDVVVHLET